MQILPLFAQMHATEPMVICLFLFATIAFLVLCGGVFRRSRTASSQLIALGILVAVVSVVYGELATSPTTLPLTTTLMKIGVILILAGVAYGVPSTLGGSPATDTTKAKEPVHE